jgi:hypothetical protein
VGAQSRRRELAYRITRATSVFGGQVPPLDDRRPQHEAVLLLLLAHVCPVARTGTRTSTSWCRSLASSRSVPVIAVVAALQSSWETAEAL